MLTIQRLPLLFAIIFCIEISIYLWAVWTSTFDSSNFFGITPEFIFDKCARNAGRVSSFLILIPLLLVGYYGLKKVYFDDNKKEAFQVLIALFAFNHLIHLIFVLLRFHHHGLAIRFDESLNIGGIIHGFITFFLIFLMPFLLWFNKILTRYLYTLVILHLLNVNLFIIKTFIGKINPPTHPAYHNQLGVVVFTLTSLYILYRVYVENRQVGLTNE